MALILDEQLNVLVKGTRGIARWEGAADAMRLVVARLRSAYLVRWFGTPLPTEGIALKVGLANIDELRARYAQVATDGARSGPGGPNLTEPLLGWTGSLMGAFASPLNSMLLGAIVAAALPRWWTAAIAGANWIGFGLLFTVGLPLAALGVAAGLPPFAISGQMTGLHDLAGAAAELARPLTALWEQLRGPRSAVRNPVLRALLELGDRVAGALAHAFALIAVVIARIGPILDPLVAAAVATLGIAASLWDLIRLAFEQVQAMRAQLMEVLPGVMSSVARTLTRLLRRLGQGFRALWTSLEDALSGARGVAERKIRSWWTSTELFVEAMTVDHPTVRYLRSLAASAEAGGTWFRRAFPPSPSGPPGPVGRWLRRTFGVPTVTPALPALPALPELVPFSEAWSSLQSSASGPGPFDFGPEQWAALRRAANPPSVFGAEWAELGRMGPAAGPTDRAVRLAAYLSLVERLAAPVADEHVRDLEGLLSRLDAAIRPAIRHPVRISAAPGELRPRIRVLRVRSTGHDRAAISSWIEDVRRAMQSSPYPVPAEG